MALLRAAESIPQGVEVAFFQGLRDLPHFNPDLEAAGEPESVARWRQALSESDAVLIACPEHGFSLPGTLKNAHRLGDWLRRARTEGRRDCGGDAGPGTRPPRFAGACRHAQRSARHDRGRGSDSARRRHGVAGCEARAGLDRRGGPPSASEASVATGAPSSRDNHPHLSTRPKALTGTRSVPPVQRSRGFRHCRRVAVPTVVDRPNRHRRTCASPGSRRAHGG